VNAEAHAWSAAPFEGDAGRTETYGHARPGSRAASKPPRSLRTSSRRTRGTESESEGASWNVLAKELVPFPRSQLLLGENAPARGRPGTQRDDQQDADRARRYGEAWLEQELLAIRYRADAGYPSLDRQHLGAARPATVAQPDRAGAGAPRTGMLRTAAAGSAAIGTATIRPARHLDTCNPDRRARDVRGATQTRTSVASELRGLRRLLPGVATLAVLAGVWAGAGMLATLHRPPLVVLSGSVKTPAGYVYVVRPGDTLWSIAARLQPGGDPRVLVAQLETQVRGTTLVPGSRLVLP
jgi:hypothetical protein